MYHPCMSHDILTFCCHLQLLLSHRDFLWVIFAFLCIFRLVNLISSLLDVNKTCLASCEFTLLFGPVYLCYMSIYSPKKRNFPAFSCFCCFCAIQGILMGILCFF